MSGPTETLTYLHTDHLGTPRFATGGTQAIVWRWEGEAFGTTPAQEDADFAGGPTTINLRFPGQYYDAESGLFYNWNRYYDAKTGRYITSDPIGLDGGLSNYAYVDNNSLRWTDPSGLFLGIPGFGEQGSIGGSFAVPLLGGIGIGGGFDVLAARTCCSEDGKKYVEIYIGFNVGISAGASVRASGSREGLVNIVTFGDASLPRCLSGAAFRGPRDANLSMTFSGPMGAGAVIGVEQGQSGGPKANIGISPAAGASAVFNLVGVDVPIRRVGPVSDCCQ